jgi:hypothetical protein
MMGTKERNFQPLPEDISLEDLVPEDNFYRILQEKLDLSFVRELVEDRYAASGRPSIDPEDGAQHGMVEERAILRYWSPTRRRVPRVHSVCWVFQSRRRAEKRGALSHRWRPAGHGLGARRLLPIAPVLHRRKGMSKTSGCCGSSSAGNHGWWVGSSGR